MRRNNESDLDYLDDLRIFYQPKNTAISLLDDLRLPEIPVSYSGLPRRSITIEKTETDYVWFVPVRKHKTTWKIC